MPLFEFMHPPPSRPAVVDESIKDMELISHILRANPDNMKPLEDSFGPVGPIITRWLSVCEAKNPFLMRA